MPETRIGVIHYNWPGFTFESFLEFAARTGFGYVELQSRDVWNDDTPDPEARAHEVAALLKKHGLKISALSANNDFIVPSGEERRAQTVRMKRVVGLASILGTNVLRAEGGWEKDSVPREKWFDSMVACFRMCAEWLDDVDAYLALDNHGTCTNDGDLQLRIFRAVGSPRLGANLDTMNYRWFGHDIATINRYYEILAPYTFHTHMKDGTGARDGYKGAELGAGEIDLHHAIKCLKDAGYEGCWTAEYEGPEAEEGVGYAKCCRWLKANI